MEWEEARVLKARLKAGIQAAKRKEDAGEIYGKLTGMFKDGTLDRSLYHEFGWLIYYLLRNTPLNSVLPRKRLMHLYLLLELERPSLLHSLILVEALKLKKKSPAQFRLRDFMTLWGIENLRDEDWVKAKTDTGRLQNSLVENLIATYIKEIKRNKCQVTDSFLIMLERAIQTYPSNPNLPLYKAIALASQGRRKEALMQYKTLLRQSPKKLFLWSDTEELLPPSELDTKIALLCKALTSVRDMCSLGEIRLRLANLLYRKGLYANARYELDQYERFYNTQRWRVNRWGETLRQRLDSVAPDASSDPTPYDLFLPDVDRFLQ